MKKQHIAFLGGACLILVFMLASNYYSSQREERIARLARNSSAPLVRDHSQSLGPADAKVVIVEFFDPACGTCRDFAPHVKDLLSLHKGKLRLVLRYTPFHKGSDTMVKILEAARRQGKFWETLQVMFDTQSSWASHHQPKPDEIWKFLPSVGLNIEKIRSDMNDPRILEIIRLDITDAQTLSVRKTPGFFVNGKPLPSFGLSQLKALVNEEIEANY